MKTTYEAPTVWPVGSFREQTGWGWGGWGWGGWGWGGWGWGWGGWF